MTDWFGESWGAPINHDQHVPTPVGSHCMDCHVRIEPGDRGVMIPTAGDPPATQPFHLHCFLDSIGFPALVPAARAVHRPLTRGLALDLREEHWSIEQIAEEYGREPEEVRALLSA